MSRENWKTIIETMDVKTLTDDQLSGLKVMAETAEFQDIHSIISAKIYEYTKHTAAQETVAEKFQVEAGEFYETFNHSIVFCLKDPADEYHQEREHRIVVLCGGHTEHEYTQVHIVEMVFGSFEVGGIYLVDAHGMSPLDRLNKKYPMHLARKLPKVDALDIISRHV